MVEMFQSILLAQDPLNPISVGWMIQSLLAVSVFEITSQATKSLLLIFQVLVRLHLPILKEVFIKCVCMKTQRCGAGDRWLSFKFTVHDN
jgi:hypothetical protein